MRNISILIIYLFVFGFLTACGSSESDLVAEPVELPTAAAPAVIDLEDASVGEGDASDPRAEESATDAGLPPTFTPEPTIPPNEDAPVSVEVNESGTPIPGRESQIYVVQAGDTLAAIAANFGITLDELVNANNITNIDQIEIGDEIIIP